MLTHLVLFIISTQSIHLSNLVSPLHGPVSIHYWAACDTIMPFCLHIIPVDYQSCWHLHNPQTGETPSPHHAHHGLCLAAVPEEAGSPDHGPRPTRSQAFVTQGRRRDGIVYLRLWLCSLRCALVKMIHKYPQYGPAIKRELSPSHNCCLCTAPPWASGLVVRVFDWCSERGLWLWLLVQFVLSVSLTQI